jgi:hypothetical protein
VAIAEAVAEVVADPASQVVFDPLMLLVHDRDAVQSLVDEVAAPTSERTLHAALAVCELAADAGRFGGAAAPLGVLVRDHLADRGLPAHIRRAAADLAAVLAGTQTPTRRGAQDLASGRAAAVASLTNTMEAALDVTARGTSAGENRMLSRLVDELLFSRQLDVRLGAAAVLAASPFGRPLADALARDLATSPPLREWAFALGTVGDARHRPALEALLDGQVPHGVAAQAAFSLGNLPGRTDPALLTRAIGSHGRDPDAKEVLRAVVYAAGMQRATHVLSDVRDRPDLPAEVRAAARWWLARPGPAPEE